MKSTFLNYYIYIYIIYTYNILLNLHSSWQLLLCQKLAPGSGEKGQRHNWEGCRQRQESRWASIHHRHKAAEVLKGQDNFWGFANGLALSKTWGFYRTGLTIQNLGSIRQKDSFKGVCLSNWIGTNMGGTRIAQFMIISKAGAIISHWVLGALI